MLGKAKAPLYKPLKPSKQNHKVATAETHNLSKTIKKIEGVSDSNQYDVEPENCSNPKAWRIFCGSLLFEMIGSMPQTTEFVSFKSYQKLRKLRKFEGCLRVQEFIKIKEFTGILDQIHSEELTGGQILAEGIVVF